MPTSLLLLLSAAMSGQVEGVRTTDEQRSFADRYREAAHLIQAGHVIPGLTSGYVPQGIAAIPDRPIIVLSCYHESGNRASILAFVDRDTGRLIRMIELAGGGEPLTGHVGGLAVCRGWLWTAFDGAVHRLRIPGDDDLAELSVLEVDALYAVDSSASTLSSDGESLWVGDFAYGLTWTTPAHRRHADKRAWVAAYAVDESGALTADRAYDVDGRRVLRPDRVVFVRQMLQGFAVCNDVIALSTSYGASDSLLAIYESPLNGDAFPVPLPDGQATDGYIVDSRNHLLTVRLPSGAEDLEWDGTRLLLPFESGADRLRSRWRFFGAHIEDRFYLLAPETRFAEAGSTRRVAVRADNEHWTPAGLLLRAGQSLRIVATGEITLQRNNLDAYPYVDANGQGDQPRSYGGLRAPNGCLLVKIGDTLYPGGTDVTLTAASSGFVQLRILENGRHSNNDGEFDVRLTVP